MFVFQTAQVFAKEKHSETSILPKGKITVPDEHNLLLLSQAFSNSNNTAFTSDSKKKINSNSTQQGAAKGRQVYLIENLYSAFKKDEAAGKKSSEYAAAHDAFKKAVESMEYSPISSLEGFVVPGKNLIDYNSKTGHYKLRVVAPKNNFEISFVPTPNKIDIHEVKVV